LSGVPWPTRRRRRGPALPSAAVIGGLLTLALLPACFYERIDARYDIPEKITLVLVDDPGHVLGEPFLAGQVANQAAFDLVRNKAVPATVPFNRLEALRQELGDQFAMTPIDQIGRALGAQQVLHVEITSARMIQEPGVTRPTARINVKVIDVEQRTRLWPTPLPGVHSAPRSYSMSSSMFYRYHANPDERGTSRDLIQRFASHIGRDVAKLFYDHEPDIGQSAYRGD